MSEEIDNKLFDFKKLFEIAPEKAKLVGKIAKSIHTKHKNEGGAESEEEIATALARLVMEDVLVLDAADLQKTGDQLVDRAKNAITTALKLSGQPGLMIASAFATDALRWIRKKFNRCGGTDRGNPPSGGKEIKQDGEGRHVILYYLEEDAGEPKLPRVEGSRQLARHLLEVAFENWELFLKIDIVRTDKLEDANLIVTGREFDSSVPTDVVALTDIGPPGGLNGGKQVQLRMVFDLGETYDKRDDFEATAAHEMGHALGVRHRDITNPVNQLMNDTLTSVKMPNNLDLEAAMRKGWLLKT